MKTDKTKVPEETPEQAKKPIRQLIFEQFTDLLKQFATLKRIVAGVLVFLPVITILFWFFEIRANIYDVPILRKEFEEDRKNEEKRVEEIITKAIERNNQLTLEWIKTVDNKFNFILEFKYGINPERFQDTIKTKE